MNILEFNEIVLKKIEELTIKEIEDMDEKSIRRVCAELEEWTEIETTVFGDLTGLDPADGMHKDIPHLTLDVANAREKRMSNNEFVKFRTLLYNHFWPKCTDQVEVDRAVISADAITRARWWFTAKLTRRHEILEGL